MPKKAPLKTPLLPGVDVEMQTLINSMHSARSLQGDTPLRTFLEDQAEKLLPDSFRTTTGESMKKSNPDLKIGEFGDMPILDEQYNEDVNPDAVSPECHTCHERDEHNVHHSTGETSVPTTNGLAVPHEFREAWLGRDTSYIWKVGTLVLTDSNKCDFAHALVAIQRAPDKKPEFLGMLDFDDGENMDIGRTLKRAVKLMGRCHPAFEDR